MIIDYVWRSGERCPRLTLVTTEDRHLFSHILYMAGWAFDELASGSGINEKAFEFLIEINKDLDFKENLPSANS